jgi:hypothetical protein
MGSGIAYVFGRYNMVNSELRRIKLYYLTVTKNN